MQGFFNLASYRQRGAPAADEQPHEACGPSSAPWAPTLRRAAAPGAPTLLTRPCLQERAGNGVDEDQGLAAGSSGARAGGSDGAGDLAPAAASPALVEKLLAENAALRKELHAALAAMPEAVAKAVVAAQAEAGASAAEECEVVRLRAQTHGELAKRAGLKLYAEELVCEPCEKYGMHRKHRTGVFSRKQLMPELRKTIARHLGEAAHQARRRAQQPVWRAQRLHATSARILASYPDPGGGHGQHPGHACERHPRHRRREPHARALRAHERPAARTR